MAQERTGSAGKHGGKATTLLGKARVTDRIHTAMEAMQSSRSCGPVNRAPRVAERTGQLTDRDDPVLALRKVCQGLVGSLRSFVPHSGQRERSVRTLPRELAAGED